MKNLLLTLISLFSLNVMAQDEVPDTVYIDDMDLMPVVTQHPDEMYDLIDTCTARYAIVKDWIGRCGIYDIIDKKNITELCYRELYYSRTTSLEDGSISTWFAAKKGRKQGIVTVGDSGNVVSVMSDDDDLSYSLDSCKTIDGKITKMARTVLLKELTSKKNKDALNGQVLVMDSQTGQIKAWVSLEKEVGSNKYVDVRPRASLCSTMPTKIILASMAMPEAKHEWMDVILNKCFKDTILGITVEDSVLCNPKNDIKTYLDAFIHHSDVVMARTLCESDSVHFMRAWRGCTEYPRELDALTIAGLYNVIALNGVIIEPSVISDSVRVVDADVTKHEKVGVRYCREVLKTMLQEGGVGSEWTTKKVDLSGDYSVHYNCCPTIYDDNAADLERYYSDEGLTTYNQVIFAGYLPSDKPRYTICVTLETKAPASDGRNIGSAVNKLAQYLNKR